MAAPSIDTTSPACDDDIHAAHREAAAASWYATTPMGYIALGYEPVHEIVRDRRWHEMGVDGLRAMGITEGPLWDWFHQIMSTQEGEARTRLRRLVSQAFTPREVERLRPVMRATAEDLLDELLVERRLRGGDLPRPPRPVGAARPRPVGGGHRRRGGAALRAGRVGEPRIAREAFELHGLAIEPGTIMMPSAPAANRDPAVYDDPDRGRRAHPVASPVADPGPGAPAHQVPAGRPGAGSYQPDNRGDLMDISVVTLPTDLSAPLGDLAVAVEERGLSALYIGGDHTHIPAVRTTPFPGGEELPDEYRRTYDPIVACTQVVAATDRIRTGPMIYLAAQRDPITTAKQIASLDHLSGGRIDFGVGYGWNVEEAADHRVEWSSRRGLVREHVAAMKALWTEDEASFAGEHVSFERAWMWPKPAARPHPPVLLGASPGPRTFEAIADWCDGWVSVPFWGHTPDHVAQLRAVAEARGRDARELAMVVDGVLPDPAMIDPWHEAEAASVVVPLPSVGLDELLPMLDAAAALVERYR